MALRDAGDGSASAICKTSWINNASAILKETFDNSHAARHYSLIVDFSTL
jgi:hypothetical protein